MAVDPKLKQGMKSDLNAMQRAAERAARKVAQNARHNPALLEAMNTRYVEAPANMLTEYGVPQHLQPSQPSFTSPPQLTIPVMGVQTGQHAVFPVPNASGKNRYDVANMTSGQKLVGGLHLVEAANGIVKLLNKGHSFYSPQIRDLLEMEEKYVKHYQDAVSFKRKYQENQKDAIMETRFEEAKRSALQIKENVTKFCSKL